MTVILGLNAYHADSSACLVRHGKLIAAAEEERFRRIKHSAGFPSEAIRSCLAEAGVGLDAIEHVAINQDSKANFRKKVGFTLAKRPDLSLVLDKIRNRHKRGNIEEELSSTVGSGFRGEVHHVEHHLAHLASAFLVSPFDEAVVVSVDGFGDFASAAWGVGQGDTIKLDDKVFIPHSLGVFYQALTQYLGFPSYGDEYKVMGLAPYGEPRFMEEMRRIVLLRKDGSFRIDLDFFNHHLVRGYEWASGEPRVDDEFTPALAKLLGPRRRNGEELTQRHKDIARSVQAMYEEAFFHLLTALHRRYRIDTLALAGGCAMNSVANGKIMSNTPFKRLYIQSAAGDAGGAIGAAFQVWHTLKAGSGESGNGKRRFLMDHAYWGPHYTAENIAALLDSKKAELSAAACSVRLIGHEAELCRRTAEAIAAGKVIGWFQGRMEWGPRALGNRSILCDPRRADMKEILNQKIKRRESFRPFAPSILREAVPEWFEQDDDVPFMMQVYPIRKEKRGLIPAVTHVDGSGRLQTVTRDTNPLYYRLIETFRDLTGVPMLPNTSFNENEPVVCKPEEALDCFLRTRMDVLVMGNRFISRQ